MWCRFTEDAESKNHAMRRSAISGFLWGFAAPMTTASLVVCDAVNTCVYVWMYFVPFAELGVGFVLDTGLHDGACNRRTRPSRARGTACVDSEHVLVLHVSWAHSAIWGARRECGEVTFCVLAMHVLRPLDDIRLSAGGLQKCLHRSPWDPQEKNRNYCDRKSPILWPSAVQVQRRVV